MVKMVKLYPQYMLIPLVGGIALFGAAGYMVKRGMALWLALTLALIGLVILCVLGLSYGVSAYQNALAWLYQNLEPERFLEKFSKLLARARSMPVQEVCLRAHMANGYAALGTFDKALEMLADVPVISEKGEQLSAEILILNNKAQIYFQMGEVEKGKACLDQMRTVMNTVDQTLRSRYEENEKVLQCYYDALTGVCREDAYLRDLMQTGTTALFLVNISLLLAYVYLSQGEPQMARAYLEQTVEKGRDWLWPTQKAQAMLQEIPAEE